MKKAIVFTALAFSAATLSAQYNIDLSRLMQEMQTTSPIPYPC